MIYRFPVTICLYRYAQIVRKSPIQDVLWILVQEWAI